MNAVRILFLTAAIFSISGFSAGYAGPVPAVQDVEKELNRALESSRKTQSEVDTWNSQKQEMMARLRKLKNRLRWLEHETAKYDGYIERQQQSIKQLKEETKASARIDRELEPFLNRVVGRLEEFVRQDLPFLKEERARRIKFLKDSLSDYHLSGSEKLRRVLEALQVEAGYGHDIEKTDEMIILDGEPVRAHILRLGRTALFYVTPDGRSVGRYDPKQKRWEPLDPAYAGDLLNLMDMIEGQIPKQLVMVPIAKAAVEKSSRGKIEAMQSN